MSGPLDRHDACGIEGDAAHFGIGVAARLINWGFHASSHQPQRTTRNEDMEFTRLNDGLYKAVAHEKSIFLIVAPISGDARKDPLAEAARLAELLALQQQLDDDWSLSAGMPKNGIAAKGELRRALNEAPHGAIVVFLCQNEGIYRAAIRLVDTGHAAK
ncbi:hypothetical protein ABWU93_11585 [Xanthomonas translucens pv. translucens]|uniref:hypothetical protein n=1 Tax=Xanthomonas campestris pv. translucens TaxID=343 RepID=UPI003F6E750E